MSYGWVITDDHLEDEVVSILGPSDITPELQKRLSTSEAISFKMYDDDNILYFSGKIVGDYDGYEPLIDFGVPDSGCTSIRINGETFYG